MFLIYDLYFSLFVKLDGFLVKLVENHINNGGKREREGGEIERDKARENENIRSHNKVRSFIVVGAA